LSGSFEVFGSVAGGGLRVGKPIKLPPATA